MNGKATTGSTCLRPVPGVGTVLLPPCDGQRTIAKDGSAVFSFIAGDFSKFWNADEARTATPPARAAVLELYKGATFAGMFSLAENPGALALTEDQMLVFCEKNREKLRTGLYPTFFLLKNIGGLFVAVVIACDDGLPKVHRREFSSDCVWTPAGHPRVVVLENF